MGTLYRYLHILVISVSLASACSPRAMQAQNLAPKPLDYMDLLGKPLSDETVVDLLATNDCTNASQFRLCKDKGLALWLDPDQVVDRVYLYLNNEAGMTPYKGELPLGLKFYDTMGAVQYKLNKREMDQGLRMTPGAGLPDEGGSPDHLHYWAMYKRYGITVIYNFPFPDEDATIYAIVVNS